jgi:hypothetical protein
MNDELKTNEYFKSMKHIKLSDSSRDRIKEDLLTYARFHVVTEGGGAASPKRSPFLQWLFSPVSAALVLVLIVGTTSVLLKNTTPAGPLAIDDTQFSDSTISASEDQASTPEEVIISTPPTTLAENTNPQPSTVVRDTSARSANAKFAPESAASDVASDEMSTLLSQGNWSAADHSADIALRETTYRALIKKYDAEIETDAKNEFITKLDQAAALSAKIEGTPEEYARASLDKASVLIGEVEAELSMLGQVEIRDGVIVDIDFSVNLVPEQ